MTNEVKRDRILVCGLGSLGQHCVVMLHEFGVEVSAVEQHVSSNWELPHVPTLLTHLWIGDCRHTETLEQAQIRQCRAVLLVTSDDQVNIEAAFAARLLNPMIRLVVRSAQQNLNQLLTEQIGNFVAFEPSQLSASAFALAALDEEVLGVFTIENQRFHVMQRQIQRGDRWCNARQLHDLNSRTRRVLAHVPSASAHPNSHYLSSQFHAWEPDATVEVGDIVITIESAQHLLEASRLRDITFSETRATDWRQLLQQLRWTRVRRRLLALWQYCYRHQIRRVVMICVAIVLLLLISGTLLFQLYYPDANIANAFYATAVLLLGGYGDLFSDIELAIPIPWWLRLFALSLTLAGTAFVGVLYALLTENLLTMRLQFLSRRPPLPHHNHVVIIGLGRVGQRVAALLHDLKQPLIGLKPGTPDPTLLPQIPVLFGDLNNALNRINLTSAKSVVAVTEDEMQNLEMGLQVHAINSSSRIVIHTYDQRFSTYVSKLFPYAQVLCAAALSAEAFVAAAFGENVLSLFRLDHHTVLVTEYSIETHDTLEGSLLAEVAYGYGVVPIFYQKAGQELPTLMPSDDLRLREGDRLVVLATSESLQRIEHGERAPQQWHIWVEQALTRDAAFDGASELALISGCSIHEAREFMNQVPGRFPTPLYKHQAMRLVRKLTRTQIIARIDH
jgi:Trk K+ transport system NAD-binding subunit